MPVRYPRGIPGYIGTPPSRSAVDPNYVAAQQAREAARIQQEREMATAVAEQRAQLEAAKARARMDAEAAKRAAAFSALTTQTNSAWNLQLAKTKAAEKKPSVTISETKDGVTTKRTLTPDQLAREQLSKNGPAIADLEAEKADHAKNILLGDNRFGLNIFSRANRVKEIDAELAKLKPPTDLLSSSDLIQPTAVMTPAAPIQSQIPFQFNGTTSRSGPGFIPVTPQGIIGTPDRNAFSAESAPLGMNRAQANDWAIGANMTAAPADLLSAPVPQDAPMAPFRSDIVTPQQSAPAIPDDHIKYLQDHPEKMDSFIKTYGEDAAKNALGL